MNIYFSCPQCGNECQIDAKYAGHKARCTSCDAPLTIPSSNGPTIDFDCPKCKAQCHVPQSLSGRTARCLGCNEQISIPAASNREQEQSASNPAVPLSSTAISPSKKRVARLRTSGSPIVDRGVTFSSPPNSTTRHVRPREHRTFGLWAGTAILLIWAAWNAVFQGPSPSKRVSEHHDNPTRNDSKASSHSATPESLWFEASPDLDIGPEPLIANRVTRKASVVGDEPDPTLTPFSEVSMTREPMKTGSPSSVPSPKVVVNEQLESPPELLIYRLVRGRIGNPVAAGVAPDRFFADNVVYLNSKGNLTAEYDRTVARNKQTPDTLTDFLKQQKIVTSLPMVAYNKEKVQEEDTPAVLQQYLQKVTLQLMNVSTSGSKGYEWAINALKNGDTSGIKREASNSRVHIKSLLEAQVPPSALGMHRLLLGYYSARAEVLEQAAARWRDDNVRGLLALRQWEILYQKFQPMVEDEFRRLYHNQKDITAPGGLGVEFGSENGYLVVKRIHSGGAADKDGRLKIGDKLVGVGDGENGDIEDVVGTSLEYARVYLLGKAGTVVRIKVISVKQKEVGN